MKVANVPDQAAVQPATFCRIPLTMQPVMTALLVLLLTICSNPRSFAASLDSNVISKVQAATFEVVIPKPTDDPVKYEKPLPLDQLPYQFRNDKYFSIGTAFALGNNRYVTAAHVLGDGIGSLQGTPALRDLSGHVYAIDKITQFSLGQDFVVFSLVEQPPKVTALETDTKPTLNNMVFTVGNALGTGVVIRDGMYTSDTPEEQDGRWKWMRFSAPASPGNSGGPLLDKDGKVIGIVLMKSPNENLNYALPIDEILKAPNDLALIDKRLPYQPTFFDTPIVGDFKQQFALPKSFADFSAAFLKFKDAFADSELEKLRSQNADQLFPHGKGSDRLLHTTPDLNVFPSLARRDGNGNWALLHLTPSRQPLPHNGYVAIGDIGKQTYLLHMRKPDDIPTSQLYGNAEQFMDTLLIGWSLTRDFGSEKIRLTSLGKPTQSSSYTDAYQRHWQVRVWPLAFANQYVMSFLLPVPDGYVGMIELVSAGGNHLGLIDMQALCDFIDVSYGGTLAQWKDYLPNTALLPGPLADIRLDFEYLHQFSYRSKRIALAYTPDLQKIEPDSYLTLGFAYIPDPDKVRWDVGSLQIRANTDNAERVTIRRHMAPAADIDDKQQNIWNKLKNRDHPNDGIVYARNDTTEIGAVVGPHDDSAKVLYGAYYDQQGTVPQAIMKPKLDLLLKDLQVYEH